MAELNKFQKMRKARAEHCEKGTETTKKALQKAKDDYREDAKAKGKSAKEVSEIVKKFGTGCPVSITGTKKRKPATKKTTTRKTRKK